MESPGGPAHLAPAYQLALDLEAQGIEGDALAERLGVPPEALASLLAVAHAKADAAATRDDADEAVCQHRRHAGTAGDAT